MKMNLLIATFILVFAAFGAFTNSNAENAIPCKITGFASIKLDSVENDSSLKVDLLEYFGPPAIDVDDSGSIYILNADNNSIDKFSKDGKRCWSIRLNEQILDIHAWANEFFTFNGRTVFVYSIAEGKLLDSINIGLKEKDVTAVGNVSKFYEGYLLINKWPVIKKEQLYIFDLAHKKVSPQIPSGMELYPVFDCPACSLSFVKELFGNQRYSFVDQSDKYIAYIRLNTKKEMFPRVYLFNKSTGERQMINKISFFKSLSFMSIRFCKFIASNQIVCCTIERQKYTPKSLKFYRLSF